MVNYQIREMLEHEVYICSELIVNTYKHENIWENFWDVEKIASCLKIQFDNPKYSEKCFVAEKDGEIIGVGGIGESLMSTDSFELYYGTVKSEYQRKGIGVKLTLKRIEYAKTFQEHGYIFVNSRFPKFFEKLGFKHFIEGDKNFEQDGGFCYLKF